MVKKIGGNPLRNRHEKELFEIKFWTDKNPIFRR